MMINCRAVNNKGANNQEPLCSSWLTSNYWYSYRLHSMDHHKHKHSPIVVITVTEYSSASLKVQRGWPPSAVDVSIRPPRVAATIEPSKRRSCSCTSIVQLRSYSTLRRSNKNRNRFTILKDSGVVMMAGIAGAFCVLSDTCQRHTHTLFDLIS